jgi:dUTP pyrophosphatase
MTVLTGTQIRDQGIVTELIDPSKQVQPCGIDLTVARIEMYKGRGTIDFDNSKRLLPRLEEAGKIRQNWQKIDKATENWQLSPGCYLITFNEVVSVPSDCMGIARPRSSLLRMGVTMETSVWDPGYKGRSQCMLVVHNTSGIQIFPNAKLLQIVFLKLNKEAEKLYSGIYQKEGL